MAAQVFTPGEFVDVLWEDYDGQYYRGVILEVNPKTLIVGYNCGAEFTIHKNPFSEKYRRCKQEPLAAPVVYECKVKRGVERIYTVYGLGNVQMVEKLSVKRKKPVFGLVRPSTKRTRKVEEVIAPPPSSLEEEDGDDDEIVEVSAPPKKTEVIPPKKEEEKAVIPPKKEEEAIPPKKTDAPEKKEEEVNIPPKKTTFSSPLSPLTFNGPILNSDKLRMKTFPEKKPSIPSYFSHYRGIVPKANSRVSEPQRSAPVPRAYHEPAIPAPIPVSTLRPRPSSGWAPYVQASVAPIPVHRTPDPVASIPSYTVPVAIPPIPVHRAPVPVILPPVKPYISLDDPGWYNIGLAYQIKSPGKMKLANAENQMSLLDLVGVLGYPDLASAEAAGLNAIRFRYHDIMRNIHPDKHRVHPVRVNSVLLQVVKFAFDAVSIVISGKKRA